MGRNRPWCTIFRGIVLVLVSLFLVFRKTLFGSGPTLKGGDFGRKVDNTIKTLLYYQSARDHKRRFFSIFGYELPPLAETTANKVGVPVLVNSWLAETLIRTKTRRDAQNELLVGQKKNQTACHDLALIQPLVGDWFRPLSSKNWNHIVEYDVAEMDAFTQKHCAWIWEWYQDQSLTIRVQAFGVCAIWRLGGIFVSPHVRNTAKLPKIVCSAEHLTVQISSKGGIEYLIASKQHPYFECIFNESKRILDAGNDLQWNVIASRLQGWDPTCLSGCCISNKLNDLQLSKTHSLEMKSSRYHVSVHELPGTEPFVLQAKQKLSDKVRLCSAGWFCNRCLRMPWRGSLAACKAVCRSCYVDTICSEPDVTHVHIEIVVTEHPDADARRIPRIIHQTWFEEITAKAYPHLHRAQNSWKVSGWDYRFYTDDSARRFIVENYPLRFVEAYDAILPGAFKADFFRLLALLKEGGIYADIDVQLDVNLDHFITRDLAFFVPRDVPLDYYPNSNYCLWNGLMGAAPGSPIIAQAVEDVVNNILNRVDYYDVERTLCGENLGAEIWKLRTLPILLLTGPCALGMSLNRALGRSNRVAGFELGWLSSNDQTWGDAMTLLTDRYDLGELRFTDVDRNLLVASSNPDNFARDPIQTGTQTKRKTPKHYSQCESEIVGEYGTYKDDQVANERIHLVVKHMYSAP